MSVSHLRAFSLKGIKMVLAYILGKVETGNEMEVLNALKNAEQVKRASLTYGTYDLCIETQLRTMEELDDFIFNVIRKIPGITDTVTLVASKTVSREVKSSDFF